MEQTGSINHNKDVEQFRKTREIMRRLRKFDQVRRTINHTKLAETKRGNSQIKFRSKTLPAGPKSINAKLSKNSL